MPRRWILTALGKDRPGIVAGVTQVLYDRGCNLEDSAMTRLGGEFAIMLAFAAPSGLSAQALRHAVEPLERRLRLAVHLKSLSAAEALAPRAAGRRYLISVYGADRPGIVFRISDALARKGINITDLHTHRSPRGRTPLYLTLLEAELPRGGSEAGFSRHLRQVAKRIGAQVSLRPADPDVL